MTIIRYIVILASGHESIHRTMSAARQFIIDTVGWDIDKELHVCYRYTITF